MPKKCLPNTKSLLTTITIAAASIIFALGRSFLKARPRPKRSTKPADGLTLETFDLAWTERVLFREARKQLERSAAANKTQGGSREPHLERRLNVALNPLTPVLSPGASL